MPQSRPSLFRTILNLLINPYRLNDSALYSLYLRIRYPSYHYQKHKEKIFYARLIEENGGDLVFDIGANSGQKAALFRKYSKQVICVEPDPSAIEQLQARFADSSDVVVVHKGVGSATAELTFYSLGPASPLNSFSRQWSEAHAGQVAASELKVEMVTLDHLITTYGEPSYIKIDVEGYELEALQGLTLPIQLLSFECNLSHFRHQTLECIAYLDKLQAGMFNYSKSEPPIDFESSQWLHGPEMAEVVACANHDYMEIYFQSTKLKLN
ncbi:FkbM family methyltransferase [Synechococcus sp. EJ6-Ellesmere]|uniref:FkbM family methyltransferase n=1 Tax=Synechococcus sp. EJ6-Ellesmere TaxID=2823734 RepID=UPI0020CC34D6|nr:FkbM family methyltransferase [Synechococcus sp. EJ6-Ellesmere]MCP9826033.1 FkbM family methyltransferase [Synechococcus sp. EJ6-Ellesmere]